MIRIKLFALFIAFALLALVRPRKCMELLEAAEKWTRYENGMKPGPTPRKECPLPPPGWRCARAAGHDGPCAAVAKGHAPPRPIPQSGDGAQINPGPNGPRPAVPK